MPRKNLIRTNLHPYHITTRSNNKEWFYIPIQDVWKFCEELIKEGEIEFNVKIEAFVLMNNHYHLCLYTPDENLDRFMRFFNKGLSEKISRQAGRINRIFGAPYKWTLIKNERYFYNVLRYIYQNPLRAGIMRRCEDYPYSDISKKIKDRALIDWFNQLACKYELERTRKNLKRYEFI